MNQRKYRERMRNVVQFIEQQLDHDIDCQQLAELACYSKYHFHRVFSAYTGQSVYAYRKRLLLERAVKHLLYTEDNVTTIAFKCGYENQASFNKAFKALFGLSPSHVRQQGVSISTQPLINPFKGIDIMTPEIKTLSNINVVSARGTGHYNKAAEQAWGQIMQFAYSNRLMNKAVESIGISHDDPKVTDPEFIRYDASLTLNEDVEVNEPLFKQTIAGGKYAVFMHKGAYENLSKTYGYIFDQWLPAQTYQLRDEPCFEKYLNRDPRRTKPENLRTEIYIPI